MDIVPDTKNWTWVLERPCPECGLDASEIAPDRIPGMLREVAGAWVAVLTSAESDLRARPAAGVWSPVEYGCHVRDVFRRFDERLGLMLDTDDPLFPNWDQDATAVADDYASQWPALVAVELHAAADSFAGRLGLVTAAAWQRIGRRSDGAVFTVESFARYFIHDPIHHLYDVTGRRDWG